MSIEYRGTVEHSVTLSGDSKKGKRSFLYFCSDGEALAEVMSARNFPSVGEPFPEIPGLYCKEIALKPERSGKKVKVLVECSYGTSSSGTVSISGIDYGKPFNFKVLPIETKVPFLYSYDETDSKGRAAKPVCSTAGEFFNLETTEITLLVRFSYYIRSFSPEWILKFCNTTNRKMIRVCGIGINEDCGLLRSLSAESVKVNDETVIQVNVELEINPAGFRRIVPNRGYFCWNGKSYSRVCYGLSKHTEDVIYAPMVRLLEDRKDETPIMPVDDPVWLDSSGDVEYSQRAQQNDKLLSFQEKNSTDWSVLSLPSGKPW